jgi:hypothetical protein
VEYVLEQAWLVEGKLAALSVAVPPASAAAPQRAVGPSR